MTLTANGKDMEYSFSVVSINGTGNIVAVDESFPHIFGYQGEDCIGKPLEMLFTDQSKGKVQSWITMLGQKQILESRHKDSSTFPVELTISEIPTGTGVSVLIVAIQKIDQQAIELLPSRKRKNSYIGPNMTLVSPSITDNNNNDGGSSSQLYNENEGTEQFVKHRRLSLADYQACQILKLGSYVIGDLISVNTKSRVYLARREGEEELLVVKMSDRSCLGSDDRLRREFEIGKLLQHENIPKYFEMLETPSEVCIVLEYCGDETLEAYTKKKQRLSESEARTFFNTLLDAVNYCHQKKIFHGDIKLSNVLLYNGKLHLIDFDASKESCSGERTTFCGTTAYMAPEMVLNSKYQGDTADVWGLGVCLFVMVTGDYPFSSLADTLSGRFTIPSYVSEGCRALISRILKVQPTERPLCSEILKDPWLNARDSDLQDQCGTPTENGKEISSTN